jgi:hypothetical protein
MPALRRPFPAVTEPPQQGRADQGARQQDNRGQKQPAFEQAMERCRHTTMTFEPAGIRQGAQDSFPRFD